MKIRRVNSTDVGIEGHVWLHKKAWIDGSRRGPYRDAVLVGHTFNLFQILFQWRPKND